MRDHSDHQDKAVNTTFVSALVGVQEYDSCAYKAAVALQRRPRAHSPVLTDNSSGAVLGEALHPPRMKALTVKNPWAWAIFPAGKDIGNRPRRTNFRGTVAIHTSLKPYEGWEELYPNKHRSLLLAISG